VKPSPERNGLILGFSLVALLLGWVSFTSYQNASQLIESTNKSKQTYTVLQDLMQIFAWMTVAESGRRGYLFWGDESELRRYRQAVQALEPGLQKLRQDSADVPQQVRQLVKLETLLNQRIDLLDESIALRQQQRLKIANSVTALQKLATSPQQMAITEESLYLRDQIQAVIANMQLQEEQFLQQWLQRSQTNIRQRLLIEGLITASIFATLIMIYILLWRQLAKRQQAELLQSTLRQERQVKELQLRFFSMASHEFRTPLTVILGSTQLLAANHAGLSPERVLKNLDRIQSSAKLMTQLLDHILTLSRADVGTLEFRPKPLDIEAFCLNLIEDLQLAMESPRSLKFSRNGTCGYAHLDEALLYSILSNLLTNALHYSASDQPVEFQLECQPDATTFQVQDFGKGIPQMDIPRIFEPFYRGQNGTGTVGSGLGLAVVKKCVDLHGGTIAVKSPSGQGTTFTVRIPQPPPPAALAIAD
jgi:signal transduction histidine kinase